MKKLSISALSALAVIAIASLALVQLASAHGDRSTAATTTAISHRGVDREPSTACPCPSVRGRADPPGSILASGWQHRQGFARPVTADDLRLPGRTEHAFLRQQHCTLDARRYRVLAHDDAHDRRATSTAPLRGAAADRSR